jgi:hypothetical protein
MDHHFHPLFASLRRCKPAGLSLVQRSRALGLACGPLQPPYLALGSGSEERRGACRTWLREDMTDDGLARIRQPVNQERAPGVSGFSAGQKDTGTTCCLPPTRAARTNRRDLMTVAHFI